MAHPRLRDDDHRSARCATAGSAAAGDQGTAAQLVQDQIGINQQTAVKDLLAAAVPSLFATAVPELVDAGLELQDLATSIPEAIKVSRLSASDALDIPVNRLPGSTEPGKLLFFRDAVQSFNVGTMKFTIVGPTEKELTDLKKGWVTWLQTNKDDVLAESGSELKRRIDEFSNGCQPTRRSIWPTGTASRTSRA